MKEFKTFILRGNVVDLAVGVVIGTAFGTVVSSLVKNLLTPLVTIPGRVNFAGLEFRLGHGVFHYGQFVNDLISFLLIATAVFFFVVKPVNKLMTLRRTNVDVASTTRDCPECLSSIPVAATRCAFCTSPVAAAETA